MSAKGFRAVIKFVIAHGHCVIPKRIHDVRNDRVLVVREKDRPLKLVPRIQKKTVPRGGTPRLYKCCQTGGSAQARAVFVLNRRTGRPLSLIGSNRL